MGPFAIRQARLEDAAGIGRVQLLAWRESYRGLIADDAIDRHTEATRAALWRHELETRDAPTYVAIDGNEIVAFANAFPDDEEPGFDAYLNTLYVLARAHRRGIATQLVRRTAGDLLAMGCRSMWWLTLKANPFRAFYDRIGGRVLREQPAPEYLGPGVLDVVYGLDDLRTLAG